MRATDPRSWILRATFVIASVALAILLHPFGPNLLPSLLTAAVPVVAFLLCEQALLRMQLSRLVAGATGLLLGITLGLLVGRDLRSRAPLPAGLFLRIFLPLATGFLGVSVGFARAESIHFPAAFRAESRPESQAVRYLDSSALIDGRIADLVNAGFVEGRFVVPQFVLNELQTIADTADAARRTRGRRGLDIVAQLQKSSHVRVEISPVDYGDVRGVDLKLIEAAKERAGQLITTDFNLSKLAQVQGIRVLNVNELATALRPVVLQGEALRLFIAKEGKEANQGIGYLEDGTMVVVDGARRQIGKTIDVLVTSVVQNAAGKLIFAKNDDSRSAARVASRPVFRTTASLRRASSISYRPFRGLLL